MPAAVCRLLRGSWERCCHCCGAPGARQRPASPPLAPHTRTHALQAATRTRFGTSAAAPRALCPPWRWATAPPSPARRGSPTATAGWPPRAGTGGCWSTTRTLCCAWRETAPPPSASRAPSPSQTVRPPSGSPAPAESWHSLPAFVGGREGGREQQVSQARVCLPAHCCVRLAGTAGDEATALVFGRDGLLYTGHISGMVRAWELPVADGSDDGERAAADEGRQREGPES